MITSFLVPWWWVFNHVIPTSIVSVPFVIVFIIIFQRLQVFKRVVKATKTKNILKNYTFKKLWFSSYAGWSSFDDQYVGEISRFRIRGTVKASAEYSIDNTYKMVKNKSDLIAEPSPLQLMASNTLKPLFIKEKELPMRRRHCFHLIVASICQSTSIGVPSIVQHAIYRCNRSIIELRRAITFMT